MTRAMLLCVALLIVACGQAMAAGLQLPIEGASAVWTQPLDGSPGSMGAAVSLTLPKGLVGETMSDWIKLDIIVHSEGEQVRVDPGLSLTLTTELGVPVRVGIVLLPLTRYKLGWTVGGVIYQTPI